MSLQSCHDRQQRLAISLYFSYQRQYKPRSFEEIQIIYAGSFDTLEVPSVFRKEFINCIYFFDRDYYPKQNSNQNIAYQYLEILDYGQPFAQDSRGSLPYVQIIIQKGITIDHFLRLKLQRLPVSSTSGILLKLNPIGSLGRLLISVAPSKGISYPT